MMMVKLIIEKLWDLGNHTYEESQEIHLFLSLSDSKYCCICNIDLPSFWADAHCTGEEAQHIEAHSAARVRNEVCGTLWHS